MKERVHNFRLPIFDPCNVWLVVADDVAAARTRRNSLLGVGDGVNYHGLFAWDDKGKFFIFLRSPEIDHALIAHELFHATHRMLAYCEHHLTQTAHEPHAYLCGHLTQIVYGKLKEWRVSVGLKWKERKAR